MSDRLLTITEAAELLRTPVETLRYWRARGTGPQGFKLGRRIVYSEAEIARWVDEQREAQRSA